MMKARAHLALAAAGMTAFLVACSGSSLPARPATLPPVFPTIGPTVEPLPTVDATEAVQVSLAPLAPDILGEWVTDSADPNSALKIRRTYRFYPDAHYEYTIGRCQSSTDCELMGGESGWAQTGDGIVALQPVTEGSDGPRAYPYRAGRLTDVGDLELWLFLPGGQPDIFYANP